MRRPSVTESIILATFGLLGLLSLFIYNELSQIGKLRQPPPVVAHSNRYHFALIYQEEKNPYWDEVKQGIREEAKANQVDIEFLGPEITDMVEQVDLLNRAVASKVDGIIVQGMNEEAFRPIIDKAVKNGIPVLTIDSDSPQSKRTTYVGSDNYQAGVTVGQHIVQVLRDQGEVGVILGNFHATNQRERLKGIQDVLTKYPQIHIVEIADSGGNQYEAASLTLKILQDHPNLNMLVGLSPWDGPGIGQIIKRFQLHSDIHVLVFDNLPETKIYFQDGTIDEVVQEAPYQMGKKSVEIMMEIKNGHKVPSQVNTEVSLLTRH